MSQYPEGRLPPNLRWIIQQFSLHRGGALVRASRIEIGPVWRDHIGHHPYTPEEAHQCGGAIASGRAANQAGVIVKGQHAGLAMLAKKLGHQFQEDFGIEFQGELDFLPWLSQF